MSLKLRAISVVATAILLAACASTAPVATTPAPTIERSAAHDNLDATLWMQSAAEHDAALLGSYALARQQLDAALADARWDALPDGERKIAAAGLPPAIITDADETAIDNSAFQARRIADTSGGAFQYEQWLGWVSERRARALPGALAFFQHAAEQGVTVYYVTNRDDPAERAATLDNLRALGFPVAADGSNLMLRNDPRAPGREKGTRRGWIGERHRVLLMLGDNLGDFLDGIGGDVAARQALVERNRARWGVQWIMLPNPAYGSWESAVFKGCGERAQTDPTGCKRAALRVQ